ncbi:uncharacterized protein LOC142234909 [Haematobia irritans]|uniref:uncharacterized protein LOC142234909 n=1 Tax=Haematobia irritans TaxID=7368 RepID=UPI003F50CE15
MEQRNYYRKWKITSGIHRATVWRWKQNERSRTSWNTAKRYKQWSNNSTTAVPYTTQRRWKHFLSNAECGMDGYEEVHSDEEASECDSEGSQDSVGESSVIEEGCAITEIYESRSAEIDGSQSNDDESGGEECHMVEEKSCLLYNGSSMTVDKAVFEVLEMWISQNLTKTALRCQLELLNKMLPQDNLMPKTLYTFFKYLENKFDSIDVIHHYYCMECLIYISYKKVEICPSCGERSICYFFELDIVQQIKMIFEEKSLGSLLEKQIFSTEPEVISDISCGSEYIRVNAGRNTYDLTLILYTDGISLSKSSKSNCWPLMFMIAEIPPTLRSSFIITIGLWYHTELKPPMNLFLQPFCIKLRKLSKGIKWRDPKTKQYVTSKVRSPLFVADAPARSQIQNILNFNGECGCNMCEIKTKRCANEKRNRIIRFYPYKSNLRLRTDSNMRLQAIKADSESNAIEKGVKGHTIISCLPSLDLGTCVFPEYMHSVLLGVAKQILNIWLTQKGPWRISKYINKIDTRLNKIKPLQSFSRMPRSISLYQSYKATEMYYWILFYSIPVLSGILPQDYYQNLILLVVSLNNLLQRHIEYRTIEYTNILLNSFVKEFQSLYGKHSMTYNVHQLLHLCVYVQRWGPLWATSAFPFESHNGVLAKTSHGTKNLGTEMINNLKISEGANILRHKFEQQSMTNTCTYHLFGRKVNYTPNAWERQILNECFEETHTFSYYSRCQIDKNIYTSLLYKNTKTNNYTVQLIRKDGEVLFGSINCFFTHFRQLYFFINLFDVNQQYAVKHLKTGAVVDHIIPISKTDCFRLIKLTDLKELNYVLKLKKHVCKMPNTLKCIM